MVIESAKEGRDKWKGRGLWGKLAGGTAVAPLTVPGLGRVQGRWCC